MTTNSQQRGLTLIEICATLAIAAILLATAVTNFSGMLQRHQTEGVASVLASDLQWLRTEAVARRQSLRISFGTQAGGGGCYVIHTGAASACTCGAPGPAVCSPGAQAIKTVQAPTGGKGVQIAINVPSKSMVYEPLRGTTSPTGTIAVEGAATKGVHHVVSILGRVHTCAPAGGLSGYKPC